MRDVHPSLRSPWAFPVLPRWLWPGHQTFLYRFDEALNGERCASRWVLGFSVFLDTQGLGLASMPCERVARFESAQWPGSPTHIVDLSLPVGLYVWVASAWLRSPQPARNFSDRDLPGCFLNCGSLAVRRRVRAVSHDQR